MKKIVINKCYGGFNLSALAVARLAELQGKKAYFFVTDWLKGSVGEHPVSQVTIEEADKSFMFSAFDSPDYLAHQKDNAWWAAHNIEDGRECERDNPFLIQVVEELGAKANGKHASLRIVEIPDGVDWVIDEYDGLEAVEEAHRRWP